MRAAASRTFCTAGSSNPMRMAMMAMTTSNSISVKPRRLAGGMATLADLARAITPLYSAGATRSNRGRVSGRRRRALPAPQLLDDGVEDRRQEDAEERHP